MNISEIKALSKYITDTGYVVVYVIDDENYEVTSMTNEITELTGFQPDVDTINIAAKNIIVYKEIRNWRMDL